MSELQTIIDSCTGCGICTEDCDFLSKYGAGPKELAEHFQENGFADDPIIPYSCNLCGLCEIRCPGGLNIGKMIFEIREEMVKNGSAPLPQHAPIKEIQQFYISDEFKVALPAHGKEKAQLLFFPGCALSAYSPDLVLQTYEHIRKSLPETGIMLGCCGGPVNLLGDVDTAAKIEDKIADDFRRLGATGIITACPYCYQLLKINRPELNPISLYTILEEIGVPAQKSPHHAPYTIHDPCSTRNERGIQESARVLLRQSGHEFIETGHSGRTTHCCGMGGMVYAANAEVGAAKTRRTIKEAKGEIVTYCATCRETIAGQKGQIVHLLDLIFNPAWKAAGQLPPKDPQIAKENLRSLKKKLVALSTKKAVQKTTPAKKKLGKIRGNLT
jgi:Fe-S oxidoreductase